MFKSHRIDERMRTSAHQIGTLWLFVTHVLFAGVLFFRLYVLGQPDEELRDFQAVLAISIFGNIALQLYFSGVLPVPGWRGTIIGYLVLMGMVAGGCLMIYGVPPLSDWKSTWLPALLGPALLVGLYRTVALLGQRRVERQIEE
jgi:hypothetical protein